MGMSSKKHQIPAIRFKGFTDAWEQRKFKNFIFKAGKKNTKGEDFPAFSVSNKLGLVNQSEQFDGSRLDNLDKTAYKLVNPGEFAYNPARINVGSIALNNLEETVIVSSLYVVLKMDDRLDNEFILQFIKSNNFINEVIKNTEGSVREYLFFENFKNVRFPYVSNIEEQIKIGVLFKQLDNTINLHQRQLDNYKDLKKAMMQKIFNQELCLKDEEGNEYPEWEEKKVSDLFSITRGVVISKPSISEHKSLETPYPVFSSQTSNFGILGWSSEYDFEGLYLTWTTDGAGAGKVFSRTGKFRCTNVCGVLVGKIESYSNSCIKELLEKETPKHVSYVGNPKLMNNVMGQIKITVPSLKEQLAISCLFELFDREILFQENLIEKLREQKEGLMQQMFV